MEKNKSYSRLIVLVLILMLAVLGLGGYIIYDKVLSIDEKVVTEVGVNGLEDKINGGEEEDKINNNVNLDKNIFDREAEIDFINNDSQIQSVLEELNWIGIVSGFAYQKEDGTMTLKTNVNLLEDEEARQMFVMEYILNNPENYEKFTVLDAMTHEIIGGSPTQEFTSSYLKYDDFNLVYKSFFNADFDLSKAHTSDTFLDESGDYVYYINRRYGANGLYAEQGKATEVIYDETTNTYTASIEIVNSERLADTIGSSITNAEIIYNKDNNGNIILISFILR